MIGEFYHEEDRKQKESGKRRAYKKNWALKKYAFKTTTSPNERKATRTLWRHPKMTRIRRHPTTTSICLHHTSSFPLFIAMASRDATPVRPPEAGSTQLRPPRRGPRRAAVVRNCRFHGPFLPPRERRPPRRRQLATFLHHLLHTRRRHEKDANTLAPENACLCNIGLHGRVEMSAPLIWNRTIRDNDTTI